MQQLQTIRDLMKLRQGFLPFLSETWKQKGDPVEITIGPSKFVLAVHPDYVKHVAIDARTSYDKKASYEIPRKYLLGNGLVTSTGADWARQRRLMSPFFTPTNIQVFAETMIRETQHLANRWTVLAKSKTVVEMLDEMMSVTAQIILKTMFSSEDSERLGQLKESVEYLIGSLTARSLSPLTLPDFVPTPSHIKHDRELQKVQTFIRNLIQARRQVPEDGWPDDLLSRLLQAQENGQHMSDVQIQDECITIFFAGHETTARTMSFTWYALAQHPLVEAALHQELDTVLGDRPLTLDLMKRLPYTLQVIKETLRLYPAAPLYVRDAVADNKMGGLNIRKGTPVFLSPFLTHRHPDFWNNPEQFDPDRWTPEAEKARHPYAYHPFAAGQRVCIGNNFSLLESHILLSILAHRYAPRLTPENHIAQLSMKGTLHSDNGLPMIITSRTAV